LRIDEQIAEFRYQEQQGETTHSELMREVHEKYCSALDDLKKQNDTLKAIHIDQLNELTTTIKNSNEKHQRELEELEASFNDKIIVEYEKQKALQAKIEHIIEEYEDKLRKSVACTQDSIGKYVTIDYYML
jgi:DNA anti-recombination protein RmuC